MHFTVFSTTILQTTMIPPKKGESCTRSAKFSGTNLLVFISKKLCTATFSGNQNFTLPRGPSTKIDLGTVDKVNFPVT